MQFVMQILQMEQDRRREEAERAEKQKKEDREFQLRLFSMIYSSNTGSPFPPSQSFYYNNPQHLTTLKCGIMTKQCKKKLDEWLGNSYM